MNPIKFKGSNVVFAENQKEYKKLPAFLNKSPKGEVITCWKFSWRERLQIIFGGNVWVTLLTFNRGLPPMFISTNRADHIQELPPVESKPSDADMPHAPHPGDENNVNGGSSMRIV